MRMAEGVQRARVAQRILVLGSSGVGKTRFTLELARRLGLEAVHLDEQFRGGGSPTALAEWRTRARELAAKPAWIMDGTYENSLDCRLPRAELVLILERSRVACLLAAFGRHLLPSRSAGHAARGGRFDRALVRYIWRFESESRQIVDRCLREQGRTGDVCVLRGRAAASTFLRDLTARGP